MNFGRSGPEIEVDFDFIFLTECIFLTKTLYSLSRLYIPYKNSFIQLIAIDFVKSPGPRPYLGPSGGRVPQAAAVNNPEIPHLSSLTEALQDR